MIETESLLRAPRSIFGMYVLKHSAQNFNRWHDSFSFLLFQESHVGCTQISKMSMLARKHAETMSKLMDEQRIVEKQASTIVHLKTVEQQLEKAIETQACTFFKS